MILSWGQEPDYRMDAGKILIFCSMPMRGLKYAVARVYGFSILHHSIPFPIRIKSSRTPPAEYFYCASINFLFGFKLPLYFFHYAWCLSTGCEEGAGGLCTDGRCSGHVFALFSHNGQQNADVDDPRRRCFPERRDFPAPGTRRGPENRVGRGVSAGCAQGRACSRPALAYAAMVSKSSLALLLDGLAPSTVSRCWRASSLRPR